MNAPRNVGACVARYCAITAVMSVLWCGTAAAADAVTDWNNFAVSLLASVGRPPNEPGIAAAYMHVAIYDAINAIEGGYTPGARAEQFRMKGLDAQTSVLICFEDVFPHLARRGVEPRTDFLVNLTNDGWFGESAEQWQHAFSGLFRAVENHLPLVRCCNNGLSCWVDARGRLQEILRDEQGRVYGPGFMTVEIPLLAAGEVHELTFYTRHGDWFGWGCVVLTGAKLAWRFARTRRPNSLLGI